MSLLSVYFAGQYGAGNTITFQKGKSKASKVSKENRKHFDDSKSQLGYRKYWSIDITSIINHDCEKHIGRLDSL